MLEELKIWMEKRFSCGLPQLYYDMLQSDKLQEYKNLCFYFVENGERTSTDVHFWYAYDKDVSYKETYSIYLKNGVISKNYFPVGEDSCGNLICIYLEKKNRGAVYFVDHELFSGSPIRVNDTFEEFIHNLGHNEDVETALVPARVTQKKKEVLESVEVNEQQYVEFFQNIKKKLPEKFLETMKKRGGEIATKRINFEDLGVKCSWIVCSFLDYSESLEQYKECQKIRKLKNNYLPFMQSRKMDYVCVKCGGRKYVGAVYVYDGVMDQLYRAYDNIETFLNELENGPEVELPIPETT